MTVVFVVALFAWFAGLALLMLRDLDEARAQAELDEVGVDRSLSPSEGLVATGTVGADIPREWTIARSGGDTTA